LTPEEKPLSDNNTNEKELKSEPASRESKENMQNYPFPQMHFNSQQQYYPIIRQQYYGYTYMPEAMPCVYPLVPSLGSLYWM
jgi:hypothetical protein